MKFPWNFGNFNMFKILLSTLKYKGVYHQHIKTMKNWTKRTLNPNDRNQSKKKIFKCQLWTYLSSFTSFPGRCWCSAMLQTEETTQYPPAKGKSSWHWCPRLRAVHGEHQGEATGTKSSAVELVFPSLPNNTSVNQEGLHWSRSNLVWAHCHRGRKRQRV